MSAERDTGPRFSPALLDEIRRRVDLVGLIGRRVRLKVTGGGRDGIGCCCFHNEKTPSFHVYGGSDAHYHCFGCGAHGDVFTYVMQVRGVEFADAVAELCAECGLENQLGPGSPKIRRSASQQQEDAARREAEDRAARARQAEAERRRKEGGSALALDWWRRGVRPEGSVVEAYLAWRCCALDPIPPCVRYCAGVPQSFDRRTPEHRILWDAMLLGVQDPAGKVRALHITYLTPDGRNAEPRTEAGEASPKRRMLGPVWGCAVRLTPFRPGLPLHIGEGFETVASVMLDLGAERTDSAAGTFWAALSLNNMAGSGDPARQQRAPLHPTRLLKDPKTGAVTKRRARLPTEYPDMGRPGILVPAGVTEIVQLCDGDSDPWDTRALIARGTRRHQARGLKVRNAWAARGMDFNDMRRARLSGVPNADASLRNDQNAGAAPESTRDRGRPANPTIPRGA